MKYYKHKIKGVVESPTVLRTVNLEEPALVTRSKKSGILNKVFTDMQQGKNIELYLAIPISAVLVIFNYIGIAPVNWIWSSVFAVLLLLAISTISNRQMNENILNRFTALSMSINKLKNKSEISEKRLGVIGITDNWTDFIYFNGEYGKRFKEKLDEDSNSVNEDITWYIVTVNPYAFVHWRDSILDYEFKKNKKIHVKWVYHSPGTLLDEELWKKENTKTPLWAKPSPAIQADWEQLMSRHPRANYRNQSGKGGYDQLNNNIFIAQTLAENYQRHQAGSFELFESRITHFYLAFLSVPGIHPHLSEDGKINNSAPKGTYGFVHLYHHFAADRKNINDYDSRTGLYLESPGKTVDNYFFSTVQLFNEGIKRGYLHRTFPTGK